MITKINSNRRNTIFYRYSTWHFSIFDSFGDILYAAIYTRVVDKLKTSCRY